MSLFPDRMSKTPGSCGAQKGSEGTEYDIKGMASCQDIADDASDGQAGNGSGRKCREYRESFRESYLDDTVCKV